MATNFTSGQDVVLDLLRYIGVVGFDPPSNDQALNNPGLDTDDISRAIVAVNSALQTIQKWGPQDLKYGRRSASYVAARQITLTLNVSTNPKAAVASVAPPANMLGCSIALDGDEDLNRIVNITGTAVTLLRGYLGPSGPVQATVYSDCAALDVDVQAVLEPVHGTGRLRLYPCDDLDEFERLRNRAWGWYAGRYFGAFVGSYDTITTSVGTPARYHVERQRAGIPMLRVSPMPVSPFNVTFQAKLRAERVTAAIINTTAPYTDPDYQFTSLHNDEVESVLLPIARWRFFVHPALKNNESRQSVKIEYDEVMRMLQSGTTMEASVSRARASYR